VLHPSFIPDRPQRELRELTRYRTSLLQERAAEVNRLQKGLEGGNIKLAAVATDIMGASGREILAAWVGGTSEPTTLAQLAQLARGRLREKMPQLEQALAGQFGVHQRFMVAQQLAHIDFLDELIERVSAEIAQRMRPFEEAVTLLDTIPGVGRRTAEARIAEALIAEIGADMSRFPTAAHLAAWAGVAPGTNESVATRRCAPMRADAQRQSLAARCALGGGSGGGANPVDVLGRPVPPLAAPQG
jgi:transposase